MCKSKRHIDLVLLFFSLSQFHSYFNIVILWVMISFLSFLLIIKVPSDKKKQRSLKKQAIFLILGFSRKNNCWHMHINHFFM